MLDRRAFLQRLGFGTISAAAAAIRLLWVPGAKTIVIPSGHMMVAPDWVAKEWLAILQHQLRFAAEVNRTCGPTITVKRPSAFQRMV